MKRTAVYIAPPGSPGGRCFNNKGITLVELLIVISIVGILTVALAFQYTSWKGKYNVEKEIKDLYSAMLDARTRAMQTNRAYFFEISPDGRHYRISDDDSDGAAKPTGGDGIFQEQRAWNVIQGIGQVNANLWGAPTATTDTTIDQLSRRLSLPNNLPAVGPVWGAQLAGTLTTQWFPPLSGWGRFRLGFDKRGVIRSLLLSPTTWTSPSNNINDYYPLEWWPMPNWPDTERSWSICIYTDYDDDRVSDYDPDYDCINITETKISLGKLARQNTNGGWCDASSFNCVSK